MFVALGSRPRYKTLEEGSFYCAHDGGDRDYRHRRARKWFSVFFIPLVPLKSLGEFVECQDCERSYDPVVLTLPTNAEMRENLRRAMRLAAVTMIAADGAANDDEKRAAVTVMQDYSESPYTMEDLDRDLDELDQGELEEQLATVGGLLNAHSKEALLTSCLNIAVADGPVSERELDEIQQSGLALDMSIAHIKGVIAHNTESMPNR